MLHTVHPDLHEGVLNHLEGALRHDGGEALGVRDVLPELLLVVIRLDVGGLLLDLLEVYALDLLIIPVLERLTATVHVEDELGDLAVVPLVGGVGEREDKVETGDERGREIDLRGQGVRVLVEPSLLGVGGRQHGAPALEGSGDSRLGDGDLLRLHGLVERGPVLLGHLVKLVDACETLVRQDQGSSLEGVSVPSEIVLDGRGGQTGGGRRLTGREDSPGGEIAHVTQDLGLGDSGVSDQQDVGVSPGGGAVIVHLVASSEEL